VLGYFRTSVARTKQSELAYRKMLAMSSSDELKKKLRTLNTEFDREMRVRGFDPSQSENVALPSHLAALYAERERIKEELKDLTEGETND
jgi:hypothetical protein